jgi:hypothetical protein
VRGRSTRITPVADDGEEAEVSKEVSKEVVAVAPVQVRSVSRDAQLVFLWV